MINRFYRGDEHNAGIQLPKEDGDFWGILTVAGKVDEAGRRVLRWEKN